MSWMQYKLGDILQKKRDIVRIEPENEYKLVTIRLHHKGITLRKTAKGSEIKSTMSVIKSGDFLLSGIDARNGAFGIVPPELDGAIVTNDFWCLKPNEDVIDREYLLLLTETPEFDHICRISSEGVTQRIRLQKAKFFANSVEIPPISEQKDIVTYIKGIKNQNEKLSDVLNEQLDLVGKLRQAFLREAMQGKLVPQDPNDEPASELLKRIKAEKARLIKEEKLKPGKELPPIKPEEIPFPIPDKWVWCRLGDVCVKVGSGSTPIGSDYSAEGIPFFRSQNIYDSGLVFQDIKYISPLMHQQMNGTKVLPNDLLLNITGGSLGRCAMVPHDLEEGNVSQHVCIIRPLGLENAFLHYLILSEIFQKKVFESTTGAGREGLPKYNLEQFAISLPPISEQKRIVEQINRLNGICFELVNSIKSSINLMGIMTIMTLRGSSIQST